MTMVGGRGVCACVCVCEGGGGLGWRELNKVV